MTHVALCSLPTWPWGRFFHLPDLASFIARLFFCWEGSQNHFSSDVVCSQKNVCWIPNEKKRIGKKLGYFNASHSQTETDITKLQHISTDVLIKSKIDQLSHQELFFKVLRPSKTCPSELTICDSPAVTSGCGFGNNLQKKIQCLGTSESSTIQRAPWQNRNIWEMLPSLPMASCLCRTLLSYVSWNHTSNIHQHLSIH